MALNTTLRVMIESNRFKDEKLVKLLLKNCTKDNMTVLFNLLQNVLDTSVKVTPTQRSILLKHEKKVAKLVNPKLDFAIKRRILQRQVDLRNVLFKLAYDNLFLIQSSSASSETTSDGDEGYETSSFAESDLQPLEDRKVTLKEPEVGIVSVGGEKTKKKRNSKT
jgi:hypothetical protein